MPQDHADFTGRSRALLGRARVVYWDDSAVGERLRTLTDALAGPLRVSLVGGSDADRERLAAEASASGGVEVVDADPHGALLIADGSGAQPASPLPEAASVAVSSGGVAAALEELRREGATLAPMAALRGLAEILADKPVRGTEALTDELETIELEHAEPRELALRARLRRDEVPGFGPANTIRALALLDPEASGDAADLAAELTHWRELANDPSLPRAARDAASILGRHCERLLS